jgi:ATP-binding cassette subfamily F protein 3
MRVVLCEILLKKSALLLLDEPTNHLDFQTVESLATALGKSECSILLVSHDRSFVDQVCNKIFEIKDNELLVYPGSYQEYVWSTQNRGSEKQPALEINAAGSHGESKTKSTGGHKLRKKELEKEIRKLEKELETANLEMEQLETSILETNEVLLKSPEKASELALQLSQMGDKKMAAEESWLNLSEQIDSLKNELKDLLG